MGLDFAEDLLHRQLCAMADERSFIKFINTLGLALYRKVHYDLAIACFQFRTGRDPQDKVAFNNMGLCYNRLGKSREAAAAYQQGLDVDPDYKQAGSNLLYLQHYIWGADPEAISTAHRHYAKRHYQTSANRMVDKLVDLNPERPLRLGFLSGDLRFHAVSRFIEGLFAHLDRSRWHLHVYHTYTGPEDTITGDLRQYDLHWLRVHKLDTDALAAQILEDRIDILFDLAVYTQGGNPDLLAQQVAPVQINYMGYPDTSGIPAMNWRITDQVSDPPGSDRLYSERLARLPVALWNYTPWPNLPAPATPPHIRNEFITFGSMNNHAKLQREWLVVWAEVLRRVPDSVLLLKSRAMNSMRVMEEVLRLFESQGIARQRILARGFQTRPNDHFLTFHDIDICLDSVPYNGTTTTFDSLWMGVPVVTMTGDLHVNRTSASILSEMGMTDWVANSPAEFVEICVAKTRDRHSLAPLRETLRERMQATSLGDGQLFTSHFDTLVRDIWRDFCSNPPAGLQRMERGQVPRQGQVDPIQITRTDETPQISIVVCAANAENLAAHRDHVAETVGIAFEYIAINNQDGGFGLAEAYNRGGERSSCEVIVFVHDDVFFATSDWGSIIIEKFRNQSELGLLGLAGTACLQTRYPFWVAAKGPFIHGQVVHHSGALKLSQYSSAEQDQYVVAVDGLMMATSKTAFMQHHFDQETFDGFHFYDLDFSVRVSDSHRVMVTTDILAKHLSGGHFDDVWKRYRKRFRDKYQDRQRWQCGEGEPAPDSHLQPLRCHVQLDSVFSATDVARIERLGLKHPKHPQHLAHRQAG